MPQGQTVRVCARLGAVCMWELWESISLVREGETSAVKQPADHDHTHQASWSSVVMPVHGGERALEGNDCVHAYNINSTFNVISDSGMHERGITRTWL